MGKEDGDGEAKSTVVTVKFPPPLLDEMDKWLVKNGGVYSSRSELIKDAVKRRLDYLDEKERFQKDRREI